MTMAGHRHSESTRAKISAAHMGVSHPQTPETRAKISAKNKGVSRPHRGHPHSPEARARISARQKGKPHPANYPKHVHTPETRAKLSAERLGPGNPNWQGGISYEPYCPKFNDEFKERIRGFFDYRCVMCGKHQSEERQPLCCHHVEYNKQACCDGKPAHFAALCRKHHNKTSGKARQRWEDMLHRVIDEVYDGRSYLPKGSSPSPSPASTHIQ